MGDKRIKKGSETGVGIICTEVLLTETFEDDDHNVGSGGIDRCWRMEGGVEGIELIGGKVGWLTYWLALLMVMGRTAVEAPARMPITAKGM